jgi:hypothetical protein
MPKRPRSHELEDLSRNRLHRIFEGIGWTVEDISKDYGEDILVRIFKRGSTTPLNFFVQAKATDNIARYLKKEDDAFSFQIDNEHLDKWSGLHEPVFLTLWDSQSDKTYWVCIQNAMAKLSSATNFKTRLTTRISIPRSNLLDDEGIRRLHAITSTRYKRLLQEQQGAKVLKELLEDELGGKVIYSPKQGVVMCSRPSGDLDVVLFDKIRDQVLRLAAKRNKSPKEAFLDAIKRFMRVADEYERSGEFLVVNERTGKEEKRKMTTNQLRSYLRTKIERYDEESEE